MIKGETMRLGPYSLDENTGEVRWDDFRCLLTPIEQRIIEALVEHFPKPLSAEAMVEAAGRVLAERLDLELSPYPPASASDTWAAPIDRLSMALGGDS